MAVTSATLKPTTQEKVALETASPETDTGSPFLLWGLGIVFVMNLAMVIGAVVLFGP